MTFFSVFLVAAITLCVGCSVLASRDAAAGCQVADISSTYYALHRNPQLEEQNPLPVNLLAIIKLALASYIKWGDNRWEESPIGIRIFVTAIGCGAAIHNIQAARQ